MPHKSIHVQHLESPSVRTSPLEGVISLLLQPVNNHPAHPVELLAHRSKQYRLVFLHELHHLTVKLLVNLQVGLVLEDGLVHRCSRVPRI